MQAVQARTRITVKNILFATDFSQAADAAAPIAIQIARRYGAKVYGVHVNRFDDYTAAAPNAWAAMAEAAEKETKEDARRLNEQLQNVEHEVVIGEGNTWEVMSNVIEQKEIDLIVLGTRGRTGLGKVILGSVAEQILRQSPRPVLTVGPHVNLWSDEYAKMREILYATDLAIDTPIAAPYAISLAQETSGRENPGRCEAASHGSDRAGSAAGKRPCNPSEHGHRTQSCFTGDVPGSYGSWLSGAERGRQHDALSRLFAHVRVGACSVEPPGVAGSNPRRAIAGAPLRIVFSHHGCLILRRP